MSQLKYSFEIDNRLEKLRNECDYIKELIDENYFKNNYFNINCPYCIYESHLFCNPRQLRLCEMNRSPFSKTENNNKIKFGKDWKPTVVKPFKFMTRPPIEATYSKKFLKNLLEEKEREEELRIAKSRYLLHNPKPIPKTTYERDNSIKIGELKRSKSFGNVTEKGMAHKCMNLDLPPKTAPFKARPVPITNYIEPEYLKTMNEIRKSRKHDRAVSLLLSSKSPFSLEIHEAKSRIQNKLRHQLRCFNNNNNNLSKVPLSRSLPDFNFLQKKDYEKRCRLKNILTLPSTIPKPFHFRIEDRLKKRKKNLTNSMFNLSNITLNKEDE
uniref:Enkurin domain-containing protein n=1 Tax=Strongyloides stercoralis TaxID=6248 RepID=A0A0K0ED46_STRER